MNLNKLKGKLLEYNYNYDQAPILFGISRASFSHKLNGKTEFKSTEISKLKRLLNLTPDEVCEIFLD